MLNFSLAILRPAILILGLITIFGCAHKSDSGGELPVMSDPDDSGLATGSDGGSKVADPLPLNPEENYQVPNSSDLMKNPPTAEPMPTKSERVQPISPMAKSTPHKKSMAPPAGAMRTTSKACQMFAKPSGKSKVLTNISKGRKIWTQGDGPYYKVSRVKGVGYMGKSCFK